MKNTIVVLALMGLFLSACSNMTPDQINATSQGITSVVTATGQVVTPLVVNYQNGQSVQVKRTAKKYGIKLTPTPTPKPK